MNNDRALSGISDPILRTNPVWCLDRLVADWFAQPLGPIQAPRRLAATLRYLTGQGIGVPLSAVQRWASLVGLAAPPETPAPEPGVVGLLVDQLGLIADAGDGAAFVTPLIAEQGRTWEVPDHFPFRATGLQDLLLRLLRVSTLSMDGAVPERLAFRLRDGLGVRAEGLSMHVAGLLAILDVLSCRPALLRRACAVVWAEGDDLRPVNGIREKLTAFRREYDRGTLLVRHPESPAEFDGDFDQVWAVRSLRELAGKAEPPDGGPRLLAPLLNQVALGRDDLTTAHHYLRGLIDRGHRYNEAIDLVNRLRACPQSADVPGPIVRDLERTTIDLYRHLGYHEEGERLANERLRRLLREDAVTSDDERVQAEVVLAAALYGLHRFEDIVEMLQPWRQRLSADPLRVAPETRLALFNTLARALIQLDRDGWLELFELSEGILRQRDPTDLPRTWCYKAHGCLRSGRFPQAQSVIEAGLVHPGVADYSRWALRYLKADLARRQGEQWTDGEMEDGTPPGRIGHPFAFYLQATARQAGCADPAQRFHRAGAILRQDSGQVPGRNFGHFLAACMDLAESAWGGEAQLWDGGCEQVRDYLRDRSRTPLGRHYRAQVKALKRPDRAAVEALLERVPYF